MLGLSLWLLSHIQFDKDNIVSALNNINVVDALALDGLTQGASTGFGVLVRVINPIARQPTVEKLLDPTITIEPHSSFSFLNFHDIYLPFKNIMVYAIK